MLLSIRKNEGEVIMSYILRYNDFLQRTKDKIEALQILCKAYDDGKYSIAKEIAASIRVLVHDTHSSTSLLAHLGLKDSIRMLSKKTSSPQRTSFDG